MTTLTALREYELTEVEKHTRAKTIFLHLLPGAVVMLVFIVLARYAAQQGWPAALALLVTWLIAGIPLQMGVLLYLGWQRNGRFSLEGIVLNRERLSLSLYAKLVPLLLVWSAFWSTVFFSLNEALRSALFSGWPAWLILSEFAQNLDRFPRSVLWITLVLSAVMNIAVPWVEELYFRGYLLPRIPAGEHTAPLVNVVLFSLYHFWQPWENPARIITLLPVVYAVQRKRSVSISILVHILLNTLGTIGLLALILTQGA